MAVSDVGEAAGGDGAVEVVEAATEEEMGADAEWREREVQYRVELQAEAAAVLSAALALFARRAQPEGSDAAPTDASDGERGTDGGEVAVMVAVDSADGGVADGGVGDGARLGLSLSLPRTLPSRGRRRAAGRSAGGGAEEGED